MNQIKMWLAGKSLISESAWWVGVCIRIRGYFGLQWFVEFMVGHKTSTFHPEKCRKTVSVATDRTRSIDKLWSASRTSVYGLRSNSILNMNSSPWCCLITLALFQELLFLLRNNKPPGCRLVCLSNTHFHTNIVERMLVCVFVRIPL